MIHRGDRVVVVGLVARNASRGREVVIVVDVAIRTLARRHHMASRQREAHSVVVEARIQPG